MLPRLRLPPSNAVLAVIALVLVVPGLVWHDPWKAVDVISIEIAHEMLRTGDWLLPRVVGDPWLDASPLYYWIAALSGQLLGWLIPFHSAARIASALLFFACLWLLYKAAHAWAVEEDRRILPASTILVFLGSVGLIVRSHEASPDLGSLAAICAALAAGAHGTGRAVSARQALRWGAAAGIALGAVFLFAGPVVPAVLVAAVLIASLVCDEWRTRKTLAFLAVGLATALLVAAIWPLLLWLRSPALASGWWAEALRREGGFVSNLRVYFVTASWFAWPAWPLAAWALWSLRDRWREPRLFVPIAIAVLSFLAAGLFGDAWDFGSFALLAPLALLAAQAFARLPRGAAGALDWFGVMTFTFFAALVWLGYIAIMTGFPPRIAHNFARLAPGFVAQFEPVPVLFAALLVPAWAYIVLRTPPSPARAVTRWAAGVAMLWASFATLLLPWADYQKTYRPVALELRSKIPAGASCVAGRGIGWAQRAALHYHGQIATQPWKPSDPQSCPLLLIQGSPSYEFDGPGMSWTKLADIGRPGDKGERFRLYRYGR
jgi:4-amino-4-deoxy-L-arabinose transferase-like glycosyltransferase